MKNNIEKIFLKTLFGLFLCIVIGLLIYGTTIFDITDSRSQLFLFGLYGAIFFSVLKYGKTKETVFIGLMIFIIHLLIQGKTLSLTFAIRDAVFFSSLFSALFLYKMFISNFSNLPMLVRAFALSLFLGLLNIISTIFLILLFDSSALEINRTLFLNAQYAALIGIGLGIGFYLFEKYQNRIFRHS